MARKAFGRALKPLLRRFSFWSHAARYIKRHWPVIFYLIAKQKKSKKKKNAVNIFKVTQYLNPRVWTITVSLIFILLDILYVYRSNRRYQIMKSMHPHYLHCINNNKLMHFGSTSLSANSTNFQFFFSFILLLFNNVLYYFTLQTWMIMIVHMTSLCEHVRAIKTTLDPLT